MRFKGITSVLSALLVLQGCSSISRSIASPNEEDLQNVATSIAINDFSKNCNLFKKDSVFCVVYNDSVYTKATLIHIDSGQSVDGRTHQWKKGKLIEGMVSVEISCSYYRHYFSEKTRNQLPTDYLIKDGKLFYWWNKNNTVTEDIIDVLWKYDVLQTDSLIPEISNDDSQKGADYYFCRNDLSKYKRVVTNIAIGYYNPPRLRCFSWK